MKLHHVFITIFAVSSLFIHSMEVKTIIYEMKNVANKVINKLQKVDRVVEGDVFRVPTGIYKGYEVDTTEYELKTGENEPFINAWVTTAGYPDKLIIHLSKEELEDTEGSCNWCDHGHPRLHNFPSYLPLNLFVNEKGELKKEGEKVVIFHNNPETYERIKIILTLAQGNYRYRHCGNGKFDKCIRGSDDYKELVEPYLEKIHSKNQKVMMKRIFNI